MHRRTIRGVELAVWQSSAAGLGRPDSLDLVFVHGFQNDHTTWRPLLERLNSTGHRLTSFDLVGCGESDNADTWQRCTIEEYAADVVALCDALAIDRPVLIGHSLGGAAVLSAALTHPGRFAGLVLVAPASTTGLDFLPDEASFAALAYPTLGQRQTLARKAFRRPLSEGDERELMAMIGRASPEHIEGAARSMREFSCQAQLAAITEPAILVCGDRDRHMPLRNHLATWRAIPRCGLEVFFDVAHVPFAEVPDGCAAAVQRFLATITRGRRHGGDDAADDRGVAEPAGIIGESVTEETTWPR